MNREIRLTNIAADAPSGRTVVIDAGVAGPVRLEVESGGRVVPLQLSVEAARKLARSLLRITGNVVELDDGDEMDESVEPPPGG